MNIPAPEFPCREVNEQRIKDLHINEIVLQEFGYPKRAKILVEAIESQYKGERFSCYVEYVIYFAVRKKVREIKTVGYLINGEMFKKDEVVTKYVKEIRTRKFKSQKNLLD